MKDTWLVVIFSEKPSVTTTNSQNQTEHANCSHSDLASPNFVNIHCVFWKSYIILRIKGTERRAEWKNKKQIMLRSREFLHFKREAFRSQWKICISWKFIMKQMKWYWTKHYRTEQNRAQAHKLFKSVENVIKTTKLKIHLVNFLANRESDWIVILRVMRRSGNGIF